MILLLQVYGGGPLFTSEKAYILDLLQKDAQLKSLSIPPSISTTSSRLSLEEVAPKAVISVSLAFAQSVSLDAPFLIVCRPLPIIGEPIVAFGTCSDTRVGFRMSTFAAIFGYFIIMRLC